MARQFSLNLLVLLLSWGAVSMALYRLLPPRRSALAKEENRTLEQREQCQVLFVGPSYVRAQILPQKFDTEARRLGLDMKSCTFGTAGLRGLEMRRHIQRLLTRQWPKLELVVIDTTLGQSSEFMRENWFKKRTVEWHTLDGLPWLARKYATDERLLGAQGIEALAHLGHLLANYGQLGRGPELLKQLDHTALKLTEAPEAELPSKKKPKARRRERLLKSHPHYERKLAQLKRRKAQIRRSRQRRRSTWEIDYREDVRAHGLEAYFLYAPVWMAVPPPSAVDDPTDPVVLLDFDDPIAYPELYRESVRGRTHHVQGEGRTLYSQLLARELWSIRR